jgi:cobalamin biosynthetic protein CobC
MKSIRHGGELSSIKDLYPDAPKPWLDLSTGVNPIPYPWQDKVNQGDLVLASARLPEQHLEIRCRDAWVNYLGASHYNEWVLSPGSQAIINLLPHLFPDYGIALPDPTYGEHVRVWKNAGRSVSRFKTDEIASLDFMDRHVVLITNPNNPDGFTSDPETLLKLANRLDKQNSILIIDEAFCDVTPQTSLAPFNLPSNVILLRSFGKFFGLAGIRVGCFRASQILREALQTLLGPWSVNGPALIIAEAALNDQTWIAKTRSSLKLNGKALQEILYNADLEIIGATDLFSLIHSTQATALNQQLAQQGIYCRAFVENTEILRFGLPADNKEFSRLKAALNI